MCVKLFRYQKRCFYEALNINLCVKFFRYHKRCFYEALNINLCVKLFRYQKRCFYEDLNINLCVKLFRYQKRCFYEDLNINLCVKLFRYQKRCFYEDLNINLRVKLFRYQKRCFYEDLNINLIVDNKKSWRTVKPSFTDNSKNSQNITLVEGKDIVADAKTLVNVFSDGIIEKYKIHPSILKIPENVSLSSIFKFETVTCEGIKIIINGPDTSKSTAFKNIPVKIFRNYTDAFADKLTNIVNHSILFCSFPDKLKCADILPAFKKGDKFDKENYRPVSLLPTASKVFERILFSQIENYIENYLSNYLCGFRKGHSPQHCLLVMVENMRRCIDSKGTAAALLSKAFHCINHKLLIAKLNTYGFGYNA